MGTTLKRYVSAIQSLDQREINPYIIDVENNHGLLDVMNAFGRMKPAKMYKVESYVNEPLWKEGVAGTVTGSGTASISFPLTLATSPNRRKNDTIMLPDGKTADVTNVSYAGDPATTVATITAVSVDGTNLTLTSADKVKFFSNSVGEKSIGRDSIFIGATHTYNLLQTFRDAHSTSDVQLLSRVEAPTGEWTAKEYTEKFMKLKAEVNAAFIAGRISVSQFTTATNALIDADGGGIKQFARGLGQYISSWGVTDAVASTGSFTLSGDMSDFIDLLKAKKAQGNYSIFGATAPLGKVDDHLKALGSSGVTSARMSLDGKTIDYTVEKFTYKGMTFQKSLLPILDQADLFGGTRFSKSLFFQPEGRVGTIGADGQSAYQPRVQIRYKKQPKNIANKGSDVWAEKHGGMYSLVEPEGKVAVAEVDWITSQCLEINGAQHFGEMTGVGG